MQKSTFENLSVTDAAVVQLSSAKYEGINVKEALVTVADADIRFRMDGTAPTTSAGHLMVDGSTFVIQGYELLKAFRMICPSGTSEVSVTYVGEI